MNYKLGDFDRWFKPCEKCGHDTAKAGKNSKAKCWKCGSTIQRDYSDRALKKNDEYKRLYLGTWEPDIYRTQLLERLEKYYRDTPDSMSNQHAKYHWLKFKRWCDEKGYTSQDINWAKRNCRQV